jgi:hypothetical protein
MAASVFAPLAWISAIVGARSVARSTARYAVGVCAALLGDMGDQHGLAVAFPNAATAQLLAVGLGGGERGLGTRANQLALMLRHHRANAKSEWGHLRIVDAYELDTGLLQAK